MESSPTWETGPLIQSVERAFLVLRALALSPAGVTELAERVGLPKSTVARMLTTLTAQEVVEQPTPGGEYRLGSGIADLAVGLSAARNLVRIARQHLVGLMSDTGEATGLSVADGFDVHYLDQVESPNPVQVRDWTGERIPPHAVSSGLVFLAHWPAPAQQAYLARSLERFTAHTMVDPAHLKRRLGEVRLNGYAWTHEEFAEGINSVAAPVTDASGAVVAAVHVHGPAYRFPPKGGEEAMVRKVLAVAERISHQLQGRAGVTVGTRSPRSQPTAPHASRR